MLTWSLQPVVAFPQRALLPVGAHASHDGVVYRVWAPAHAELRVVTGVPGQTTRYVPLERDADGFFAGRDESGRPGDQYWFQADERLLPDPASRFQPEGIDGPSMVVDPHQHAWRNADWCRPALGGRVIYELHIGTFTPEGTFLAAISRLDALRDLGVNTIELMPLAEFPGRWNWGYDGVMLFAPAHVYGTPDELRALVDAAHARGIAVVLDVVYNHLGPVGNVLAEFSPHYFHPTRRNPWGASLNYDGAQAAPVREFLLQNACAWLDEYRCDGLRLDAVHAIEDESTPHLVAVIAAAARARGAFVIAEDERNDATIVSRPEAGGWGVDGVWADDFHHTMRVALTGERHAHFANYTGGIDEWAETLQRGWFYRGQFFRSWQRPRGNDPTGLPPEAFVFCITNHDQIGNRPLGDRLNNVVSPEAYRAVSMLLCLAPFTPLLFMGQEWAASSPFPFFSDHPGETGAKMAANRVREFQSRDAHYAPDVLARMPDPQASGTFARAKLDWDERDRPSHAGVLALYRECLRLRAAHAIFQSAPRARWRVARLDDATLGLRWQDPVGDWLLIVTIAGNSTGATQSSGIVEGREGFRWQPVLASNEARFGGRADVAATAPSALAGPGAALWRETR